MAHHTGENFCICELATRARAGDAAAFDALASHYRALLLSLAFIRTSNLEDAEDLVQEILARAWDKIASLEYSEAFVPWLKTICANACNSWYRRAQQWPRSLQEDLEADCVLDTAPLPLEQVLAREKQSTLRKALVQLSEANRLALMMHVWGGYSYEEIAAISAVPLTTVEGRIHRARRQLRSLLRDEGAAFFEKQF
jgi:RNA polymerase sigma-70 factor (ECF subfamily)